MAEGTNALYEKALELSADVPDNFLELGRALCQLCSSATIATRIVTASRGRSSGVSIDQGSRGCAPASIICTARLSSRGMKPAWGTRPCEGRIEATR